MKILIVAPKNKTVYNFRGDLVKDMIAAGNEVYVTGPNRDFIEEVMGLGIKEFFEISLVKDNTNPFGDLQYLKQLKSCINQLKPDIVFSYTVKPVIYGSLAAGSAGVKNIYGMITGLGRAYSASGAKAKMVRDVTKRLYHAALKRCKKVIFQNPDDAAQLVKMHCLPESKAVLVNGSGVNMQRFSKSELPEAPVFLMVSRIIREKGVLEYCEAAKAVKSEYPDARFVLLGAFDNAIGGLSKDEVMPYVEQGIIELPGEVKDPVSFYHSCSVYVLPSYYREGLPRTLPEAMSCGRPLITTDWTGCRLAVEDGKNGFIVPVRDSAAVADRMKRFLEDPGLIRQMGDASYEICKTKFDVRKVNRQMRDIIEY